MWKVCMCTCYTKSHPVFDTLVARLQVSFPMRVFACRDIPAFLLACCKQGIEKGIVFLDVIQYACAIVCFHRRNEISRGDRWAIRVYAFRTFLSSRHGRDIVACMPQRLYEELIVLFVLVFHCALGSDFACCRISERHAILLKRGDGTGMCALGGHYTRSVDMMHASEC